MQPWLIAIFTVVSGFSASVSAWVMLKVMDHEKQLFRLVSDRESEKGTIARVHNDFESRLRVLERRA